MTGPGRAPSCLCGEPVDPPHPECLAREAAFEPDEPRLLPAGEWFVGEWEQVGEEPGRGQS